MNVGNHWHRQTDRQCQAYIQLIIVTISGSSHKWNACPQGSLQAEFIFSQQIAHTSSPSSSWSPFSCWKLMKKEQVTGEGGREGEGEGGREEVRAKTCFARFG